MKIDFGFLSFLDSNVILEALFLMYSWNSNSLDCKSETLTRNAASKKARREFAQPGPAPASGTPALRAPVQPGVAPSPCCPSSRFNIVPCQFRPPLLQFLDIVSFPLLAPPLCADWPAPPGRDQCGHTSTSVV